MKAAALVAAVSCFYVAMLCAAGAAGAAGDVSLVVHDQDHVSMVITPAHVTDHLHEGGAGAAEAVAQAHQQQQQQQQQQVVQSAVSSQGLGDPADQLQNPITFRSQAELTVNDASTEADIPGLAPVDVAAVEKAIPDVDHLIPAVTVMTPFLPDLFDITNALGIYMPVNWPLAGTGPTGDWLKLYVGSFWKAFTGEGPRPMQAPTLLVANENAYRKLAQDVAKHSGLPVLPKLLKNPILSKMFAAAVYDQLASNMLLPNAALMGNATNGTVYTTAHDMKLTLLVKPDGSRYLVSNTTTAKIITADIWTGPPFPITLTVVDSFIVPKIKLMPGALPSLMSNRDRANMPKYMEMWKDGLRNMPGALADMPNVIKDLLQDQVRFKAQANPASKDTLTAALSSKGLTGRR